MSSINENERVFLGIVQLSFRSLLIGALGSCIITASSMYIALRIGALPWPTIFVAVLSMALLKILGRTTLNEINITQTAMSAGAMIAGGLAFTMPGLWITGTWKDYVMNPVHLISSIAISFSGMLLGTILTWFLRSRSIEDKRLPYPIGAAAAETIVTGDKGGEKSIILFSTMGLSALFTYMRDSIGLIPLKLESKWLQERNLYIDIWLSPMAAGIGYMIGILYTGVWFIGSLLSYLVIIPLGISAGIFASSAEAINFKNTAGIGLMVGTGIGILLSFVISFIRRLLSSKQSIDSNASPSKAGRQRYTSTGKIIISIAVSAAFVFSVAAGLPVIPSLFLIIGVFAASAMAATITGETGINPMEIFAIIILLAIRLIVSVDTTGAFLIAACVAIACGYSGDLLNDYKAGHILGTNPAAQLISQVVGGTVGIIVASVSMFAIISQFGGVGPDKGLSAVQAYAVSQMINGIGSPAVFGIAVAIGALLYLLGVPSMTLGLGVYLPFYISSAVFIGGIIRFIVDRIRPQSAETGNVAASGLLGGEGITGVTLAIIKMFTGT